ncbi:MAG: hypothetical protein KBG15_17190 [Kofleriaceae bacterium]|nr:hypothetical protein [Kofleriaceae bacterium]
MLAATALGMLNGCNSDGPVVNGDAVRNDALGNGDGRPADARSADARPNIDAANGVGEPAELAGMTLYHNQARLAENANPPLPQLTWDPALAVIAANWAAMCRDVDPPVGLIDHNPNRSATYPTYVGENIYGGASSAKAAVDLWMAEKPNYNLAANTCNGVCGHYTQIVWRKTLKVGCAISHCPSLRYSDSIICNYGPGGNFNGERPY